MRNRAPSPIRYYLILAAILAVGCGGSDSPTDIGSLDPGGTGSKTLLVVAEAQGSDNGGGTFSTAFTATVSDVTSQPVSGAEVTVQGPFGQITLVEDQGNPGSYNAVYSDYIPGIYKLSVLKDAHEIRDVKVTAPDIHTITSPAVYDIIPANQSFDVIWTRTTTAQECWLETRDYQSAKQVDTGSIRVPSTRNPPNSDQRIRVFRKNQQTAAGGLPGSEFKARIRNSVEPVVVL